MHILFNYFKTNTILALLISFIQESKMGINLMPLLLIKHIIYKIMQSADSQIVQILDDQLIIPNSQPCNYEECPFSIQAHLRICKKHFGHPSKQLVEADPRYNFFYCGDHNCSYGTSLAEHLQGYHRSHRFNCGNKSCTFVQLSSSHRCGIHYIHKSTCLSQGCALQEKSPLHLCEKHVKPLTNIEWFTIKGGIF